MKRAFLITIDTEGDGMWMRPTVVETRNAGYLPRFQRLCERYGFRPTWLTDYEMAEAPAFQEFGRDVLARGAGEIGMHLHAWNSPPLVDLTGHDTHHQPYLIEYPCDVMNAKIEFMTELLERRFGVRVVSHRAGRWAVDAQYLRTLIRLGYRVDCSVTPTVSWRELPGRPGGRGGSDYTAFPSTAYFMDPDDPCRPGTSPLLELPMTIRAVVPAPPVLWRSSVSRLPGLRRLLARRYWLRPDGHNLPQMLALVQRCAGEGAAYIEFMLHSSEFMPGGSPTFPDAASIEKLYADLERLFERVARDFEGCTLAEYRDGVDRGDYPAARGALAA